MANILTRVQVRQAIYVDTDFDEEELDRLASVASSFLKEKTGYDYADVEEGESIEPLAIQAGTMYVRHIYFNGAGFNAQFDYTFGLAGILIDLQNMVPEDDEDEEA